MMERGMLGGLEAEATVESGSNHLRRRRRRRREGEGFESGANSFLRFGRLCDDGGERTKVGRSTRGGSLHSTRGGRGRSHGRSRNGDGGNRVAMFDLGSLEVVLLSCVRVGTVEAESRRRASEVVREREHRRSLRRTRRKFSSPTLFEGSEEGG